MTFESKMKDMYKTKDELFETIEQSSFFKLLKKYLGTKTQTLINKPAPIVHWKGTGNAVSLNKFELHFGHLLIKIDVSYWKEYDHMESEPYGREYTEDSIFTDDAQYDFYVPMELIDNCTKQDFDKWVKTKGEIVD
jgi:hypothetical protein